MKIRLGMVGVPDDDAEVMGVRSALRFMMPVVVKVIVSLLEAALASNIAWRRLPTPALPRLETTKFADVTFSSHLIHSSLLNMESWFSFLIRDEDFLNLFKNQNMNLILVRKQNLNEAPLNYLKLCVCVLFSAPAYLVIQHQTPWRNEFPSQTVP